MHWYWEPLIEPLLQHLQPKVLVEIGAEAGRTTQLLLGFCRRHEARLHVIEPAPQFVEL